MNEAGEEIIESDEEGSEGEDSGDDILEATSLEATSEALSEPESKVAEEAKIEFSDDIEETPAAVEEEKPASREREPRGRDNGRSRGGRGRPGVRRRLRS